MTNLASPFKTSNYHTGDARKRQVAELLEFMSPEEVPFLKTVGIDGEAVTNTKYEWVEEELLAETGLVADNPFDANADGNETTLNVASGQGVNFQPYMVIKVDSEYMYVTAVTDDALTVTRAIAGTSNGTHAQNAVIEIVGIAHPEATTYALKSDSALALPYNYVQNFATSYKISDTQRVMETYGIPEGDDAHAFEKALTEIMIKLELSAILGIRRAATGAIPDLMGGLDFFLSAGYGTNHSTVNGNSEQLNEKHIGDLLQAEYYKVGGAKMAKTLIMNAWQKRRISDMFAPYARADRAENTGGVVITKLDTDFGTVDVITSPRVPKSKVYAVNLEYVAIHPLKGNAFADRELPSDGDFTWKAIKGSYTMSFRNSKSMGIITPLATS